MARLQGKGWQERLMQGKERRHGALNGETGERENMNHLHNDLSLLYAWMLTRMATGRTGKVRSTRFAQACALRASLIRVRVRATSQVYTGTHVHKYHVTCTHRCAGCATFAEHTRM
jgi:hypothetical protein